MRLSLIELGSTFSLCHLSLTWFSHNHRIFHYILFATFSSKYFIKTINIQSRTTRESKKEDINQFKFNLFFIKINSIKLNSIRYQNNMTRNKNIIKPNKRFTAQQNYLNKINTKSQTNMSTSLWMSLYEWSTHTHNPNSLLPLFA
jgi:hypothetical protein